MTRRWLVAGVALTLAAVVAVGLVLGPTTGADRAEAIGQGGGLVEAVDDDDKTMRIPAGARGLAGG